MMSPSDMEALDKAQGVEADKLFLTQMITHHQGAIDMAGNEVKTGSTRRRWRWRSRSLPVSRRRSTP